MCGRYAITLPPAAVRAWFAYVEQPNFPPRYNVAPTQPIPIVCRDALRIGSAERHFKLVRWGFVPGFAKNFGAFPLIINARAEGLLGKPSFRAALIRRRCLIIADGYYEWRRTDAKTAGTPFLIRHADGHPLAFAGLWEGWMGVDGSEMETACIITTAANGSIAAIHPRMPALLEPATFEPWLDGECVHPDEAVQLLRPAPDDRLSLVQIGTAVNKVANDDAAIQAPVAAAPPRELPRQGQLF